MYVILPGGLGYAGSWKFIDTARRVISEARKIREMIDSTAIEMIDEPTDLTPEKIVNALNLSPEQCKTYTEYANLSEELFNFYKEYGNRQFNEGDAEVFAWFTALLVSDENFYSMVEDYFKNVNGIFNELVQSSTEQKLRIRGIDILLALYVSIRNIAEKLYLDPHVIYYSMDDLFVE